MPESDAKTDHVPRIRLGYLATGAIVSSVLGLYSSNMTRGILFCILGMALSLICLIAGFVEGRAYSRESLRIIVVALPLPHIVTLISFVTWGFGMELGGGGDAGACLGSLFYTALALLALTLIGAIWLDRLGYTEKGKNSSSPPKE